LQVALTKAGIDPERLSQLRAPAGLDLGAITPEEIAVSILAEIIAVRRSKHSRNATSPPHR
jgi:xanthine dehydrogenase accessory factor